MMNSVTQRRVHKDEPAVGAALNLGGLPAWKLSDLYAGTESPAIAADFAELDRRIGALEVHRGKVAQLSPAAFGAAIAEYEAISEITGKLGSYAQLYQTEDVSDPARGRFYQNISERLTTLGGRLLFFTLEINRLDDEALAGKMSDSRACVYHSWIRDLRVSRKHELNDELEKLFLDKSTTSRTAWVRLFDETIAGVRCSVDGERSEGAHV